MNPTQSNDFEPCINFEVHPALVDHCRTCGFSRSHHTQSNEDKEDA